MFSDDMITTGISLRDDDSWLNKPNMHASSLALAITYQETQLGRRTWLAVYLDLLEQIIPCHARHAVVRDDQVHRDILVTTKHIGNLSSD